MIGKVIDDVLKNIATTTSGIHEDDPIKYHLKNTIEQLFDCK
jgi:hypothetical protein